MSSSSSSSPEKKPDVEVTDTEFNELGKPFNMSLDPNPFDMDAILDAIPKERRGIKYTDGWDPARLDEELKKHPFFMKEMPPEGEPLPPLLEALQQIKYSEIDNTPEQLALNYKEDGLFHFKLKKYRVAITCFSEAIRKLTSDDNVKGNQNHELIAQLYNNRAASQFHLENYRSCLHDCEKSINYKPDYFKPIFKAIETSLKINRWKKALKYCDMGEKIQPTNSEVQRLRLVALRKQKLEKAADRKDEFKRRAKEKMYEEIMIEIKERKIKLRNLYFLNHDTESGKHVKLTQDKRLEWPVLFCYPQYSQSDYIEAFHEDATFEAHLIEILEQERPAWDLKDEYHDASNVSIYYINFQTCGYVEVKKSETLLEVMQSNSYELPETGVPTFFVMAMKNEMCKVLYERVQAAAK